MTLVSTHRIRDTRFHTFQTDAAPHTYRPSQSSRPVDACTDTNQPQLLHPCTTHRGPLEYAVGSHLECSACQIRDSPFRTFQTDATPHTYRPSQSSRPVDACTDTNQPQLLHPCTRHRGPLQYAVGSHLECSACRIRDSHCGAPNTHVVLSHSGSPACLPRLNSPTLSCRFYPTLRLL